MKFFFCILASMQPNYGYTLPENMPFDYHCNAYGNNNSTNHNHNSNIHVNNVVATGVGKSFECFQSRKKISILKQICKGYFLHIL